MYMGLSQTMYRNVEHLAPDVNPAATVKMNNLSLRHCTSSYAVDRINGKIYAITMEGWILIPEKASIIPFPSVTPIPGYQRSYARVHDSAINATSVTDAPTAAESTHADFLR